MITLKQARQLCIEEGCGYCLTHNPPIVCCNYMKNIFVKKNGVEWCKDNIKYFDTDYTPIPDVENILLMKNNKNRTKKNNLNDYTLLDLIEGEINYVKSL